jgi:hypothetical protein
MACSAAFGGLPGQVVIVLEQAEGGCIGAEIGPRVKMLFDPKRKEFASLAAGEVRTPKPLGFQ